MDVQQSRGYNWTQGDFCRAIFSALFTGVFSYLVHLVERGDETPPQGLSINGSNERLTLKLLKK